MDVQTVSVVPRDESDVNAREKGPLAWSIEFRQLFVLLTLWTLLDLPNISVVV